MDAMRASHACMALCAVLFAVGADSARAAGSVAIASSNATPVAGGAAFSLTITVSTDAAGATNVRMTCPMPPGANFLNLTISGLAAGSLDCNYPAVGSNGSVDCESAQMPASTSATISVVANYSADLAGGARTTTARLTSDGAAASTAQVQQTISNNSALSQSSVDGASGSLRVRRLTINNVGSSSAIQPSIFTTLPARAYLAWAEPTGSLVDSCSYNPTSGDLSCTPNYIRSGLHQLTIVYGLPTRVFRNGFE